MKREVAGEIMFDEFPNVVAKRFFRFDTIKHYDIFYDNMHIAILSGGTLKFRDSNKFKRYGSLKRAMQRAHNQVVKSTKQYYFKDVLGFYARQSLHDIDAYNIYNDEGTHIAHLTSDDGSLRFEKRGKFAFNDFVGQHLNLHNALRLVFLMAQKPIV